MEKRRIIIKIMMALLSYLYKYRPYMTVWVTVFVVGGVYQSIKEQTIDVLIACIIFMVIPVAIKRVLLAINWIGGKRNRYDDKLLGVAPKGRFTNYIIEYLNDSDSE